MGNYGSRGGLRLMVPLRISNIEGDSASSRVAAVKPSLPSSRRGNDARTGEDESENSTFGVTRERGAALGSVNRKSPKISQQG